MEWHLRESGKMEHYEELKDCQDYVSRHVMMNRLRKRYNMDNKYPYKKKVKLPVCGTTIRLSLHDPGAVIQSLLTDPRIQDTDYLFPNHGPLAPPPEKDGKVSELNTGAVSYTHLTLPTILLV